MRTNQCTSLNDSPTEKCRGQIRSFFDSLKNLPSSTIAHLTAGLLIVVFAAELPLILMGDFKDAPRWSIICFYAGVALAMATVLRPETIACWNWLKATRFLGRRWNWFLLGLWTMGLIFLVEGISIITYGRFPIIPSVVVIVWNTSLMLMLISVVFALTNRFIFSVGMIYSIYIFGSIANIIKVQYLHTTIRPLDVFYIEAFEEVFTMFFGITTVVLLIVSLVVWAAIMTFLWRRGAYRGNWKSRTLWAMLSLGGIVALSCCDLSPTVSGVLRNFRLHKNLSNSKFCAERRGFLVEFLTDIPASIPHTPANYTESQIARTVEQHCRLSTPIGAASASDHVNVVVFLIESFMDPKDLGLKLTRDPLPEFRAAQSKNTTGYAVVPNEYFGSTNTEYEVVTGMSSAFLPFGACPYVQYIKHDIPSAFTYFQGQGYETFTCHGGPMFLYDRVRVYNHLHVEHPIWLLERPEIRLEAPLDPAGRYASDESVVDTIIDVSKKNPRYFMYASANSTHSPFDYHAYDKSDLDVSSRLSDSAHRELKTYLNALQTADRALGKMFNYFEHCPQKTIIVVIGDHWPPFKNSAEIYAESRRASEADPTAIPRQRKVPLLIWSNFLKKEPDVVMSTNMITTDVLARIGLEPVGFLALNDSVRDQLSVVSNGYITPKNGSPEAWEEASPAENRILQDYQLLQYDLMLGKQYSLPNLQPVFASLQSQQP